MKKGAGEADGSKAPNRALFCWVLMVYYANVYVVAGDLRRQDGYTLVFCVKKGGFEAAFVPA